jgi:hypothetical protein
MQLEDLHQLVRDGEGEHLEFKQAAIKPGDLAETLVAFANGQGGTVLIGVDDDGRPAGIPDVGAARDLIATAASDELCDPPVTLDSVEQIAAGDSGVVLVVSVPRSRSLHATRGRFLVRRGARNVSLATREIAGRYHRQVNGGSATPLLQVGAGYQALYEVLRCEIELDLLDASGALATLKRRETLRLLQEGVIGIYDQYWGQGQVTARYRVSPGVVADRFRVGAREVAVISFRDVKKRGDVVKLEVERDVMYGWSEHEEWLEARVSHRTKVLRLEVVFPVVRLPTKAWVTQELSQLRTELGKGHIRRNERGRTVLVWQKLNPVVGESYVLAWAW